MIKNRYAQMAVFLIAFIAVWNLCELIAGTFITHSGYVFTWADNIAKPLGSTEVLPAYSEITPILCGIVLK